MKHDQESQLVLKCGNAVLHSGKSDLKQYNITKISDKEVCINYKNKNYTFLIDQISLEKGEVVLQISRKKKYVRIENQVQQVIQSLGYNSKKSKYLDTLNAPMPGLVLNVFVKESDFVVKGDPLITLEAMKMENILKAPHDGVIKKIFVNKADKLEKNQVLIQFEDKA